MVSGPETVRLDDSHLGSDLCLQKQDDGTGHLMAVGSGGEPDCGEPKVKSIPGDPEWVKYLNSLEW